MLYILWRVLIQIFTHVNEWASIFVRGEMSSDTNMVDMPYSSNETRPSFRGSPSFDWFAALPTGLQLQVIDMLGSVKHASALALCSRRNYVIVHEYWKTLPQLVISRSSELQSPRGPDSARRVVEVAKSKLLSPPNVAFVFYTGCSQPDLRAALKSSSFPPGIAITAAQSESLQINDDDVCEHSSTFSIFLGSFPDALCCSIAITEDTQSTDPYNIIQQALVGKSGGTYDPSFWKVFVVNVCGEYGYQVAQQTVASIQEHHPEAAIIGGICSAGDVSQANQTPKTPPDLRSLSVKRLKEMVREAFGANATRGLVEREDLQREAARALEQPQVTNVVHVDSGVTVLAMGGTVPLKSAVSKGAERFSTSSWCISSCEAIPAGDDRLPEELEEAAVWQKVTGLKLSGGEGRHSEGGSTTEGDASEEELGVIDWFQRCCGEAADNFDHRPVPQSIGVMPPSGRGYVLHDWEFHENALWIESKEPLTGSLLNIYQITGNACAMDLKNMLRRLKSEVDEEGQELMGALMFSCAGRGPRAGSFIQSAMMDASHFQEQFPCVPLIGYYAGGEIGPQALADDHGVFQAGNVAVQGFTVVFGLFIIPRQDGKAAALYRSIDDSPEKISEYFMKKHNKGVTVAPQQGAD